MMTVVDEDIHCLCPGLSGSFMRTGVRLKKCSDFTRWLILAVALEDALAEGGFTDQSTVGPPSAFHRH